MHFLDFLSESPNIFIFQKESNKTNFGGVLFFLFSILMLLISLLYILDYALNDKFTLEAFTIYNHTDDEVELEKIKNDETLNPPINITVTLINDNFSIYDAKYFNLLEKDHIDEQGHSIYKYQIKANIDYAVPAVYFICGEGKNCSLLREYFENGEILGSITVDYPDFIINNYDDIPI